MANQPLVQSARLTAEQLDELRKICDGLMGKDRAAVIYRFGEPSKRESSLNTEMFHYRMDQGKRMSGYLWMDLKTGFTRDTRKEHRVFDEVTLWIIDGEVVKYECNVLR